MNSLPLPVETIRVTAEDSLLASLLEHPYLQSPLASLPPPPDPAAVRRALQGEALRLTPGMAPEAHASAREAADALGVTGTLEIYQSQGRENASIHLIPSPVVVEVQGRLLSLLDPGSTRALFGHELGHFLAHGPASLLGRNRVWASQWAASPSAPSLVRRQAAALSMVMELTADRFALLACSDLEALLRLEMIATTGLPGESLGRDTPRYLAQCRELMETCLREGEKAQGHTHPEHSLRAWAAWLFSETDLYRDLRGTGPGTRSLAEVNSLLRKVLDHPRLDPEYHVLDAPPQEMHVCALAASVLLATADGELSDAEASAMERVFAPLVPGWRTFLTPGAALEKFREAAPVVMAAGPDVQRALFHLLFHVALADGRIHPAELERLLEVGRALHCHPLFLSLLEPALHSLEGGQTISEGGERASISITPPPSPLRPRAGEVEEALAVFLEGFVRRGGGETTLRRLLRLGGENEPDPESMERLARTVTRAGLIPSPPLHQVELDSPLLLTPEGTRVGNASIAPPPPADSNSPVRQRLTRALSRLRDSLVSGDGRSRSVRLSRPRPGRAWDLFSLNGVSVGLPERVLAAVRGGRKAWLLQAEEAGSHDLAREVGVDLLELHREHQATLEETGACDLFLGHPFIVGRVEGYFVRAPLVLHPVDLVRENRGARSFALHPRKDEEPLANQSLLRLIFQKRRFALPEELSTELDAMAADPGRGVEEILKEIHKLGLSIEGTTSALGPLIDFTASEWAETGNGLRLEECAVLGLFPQSTSDLLQDYDGLLGDLAEAPSPGELLGSAISLLPAAVRGALAPREMEPKERAEFPPLVPVIHADPSQRQVLERARRSRALVVDGPPGTGKSQVIVNLVADALARGETVAVVSEKRAALDVVAQRLDGAGFSSAVALVHDVQEDRRRLYQRIVSRLEGEEEPLAPLSMEDLASSRSHPEEVLSSRARALAHRTAGVSLTAGQLYLLGSGADVVPATDLPSLARLSEGDLLAVLPEVGRLAADADLWAPGSPFLDPSGTEFRSSFAGDSLVLSRAEEALSRAHVTARALEGLASGSPVDPAAAEEALPALKAWQSSRKDRPDLSSNALFLELLQTGSREPPSLAGVVGAVHAFQEARDAVRLFGNRVLFPLSSDGALALSVMRAWAGSFLRFFVVAWWLARGKVKRALSSLWPEKVGHPLTPRLLQEMEHRWQAHQAWRRVEGVFASLGILHHLGERASAGEDAVNRVGVLATHARLLAGCRTSLQGVGMWPEAGHSLTPAWEGRLDEMVKLGEALCAHREATQPVAATFPWVGERPSLSTLLPLEAALRRDGPRLVAADESLERGRRIFPEMEPLVRALARQRGGEEGRSNRWREGTTALWARARVARLEEEFPDLRAWERNLPRGREEEMEIRLADALTAEATGAASQVLHRLAQSRLILAGSASKGARRTPAQGIREALLKEAKKQRNILPMRALVRKFADQGLLDLMPLWLVSPETMAVLFPRRPLFDLVIFDEASQCTVENGLPVMLRAHRAVIAGDEKQMPPTSYFTASGLASEEGASEGNGEEEVEERGGRDLLDEESLLTLARNRCEHQGLHWHYRCREEELIAFSNHAFYGGSLLTIPSVRTRASSPSLRWVEVQDGAYHAGSNPHEAEAVVEEVHALLKRTPRPSLGVVTFNIVQRRTILDEIDRRRAQDGDFSRLWEEACSSDRMDERPFVKNLENVQGDERDVILFSLGHAPQEREIRGRGTERYVPSRFGPLGLAKGERRLNVAISRARGECVVVSSFEPGQLSVARTSHDGPRLFKGWLEFARHLSRGQRAQAQRVLDGVRETGPQPPGLLSSRISLPGYHPLAAQIAAALEERGLVCEREVGTSAFRIPLAVVDPEAPHHYACALFCDDGTDGLTPFDRHVQRRGSLVARGWTVLRINARDWYRDREGEVSRVLSVVRGSDEKRP